MTKTKLFEEKKVISEIRKNLGFKDEQRSFIRRDIDLGPGNDFQYGNFLKKLPTYATYEMCGTQHNISKLEWTKTQLELEKSELEQEQSNLKRGKSDIKQEESDLEQKKSNLGREKHEFYTQKINGIEVIGFFRVKFVMTSIHTEYFEKIKGAFIPVFQKRHKVGVLLLNDLESLMNLINNYYFMDPYIFGTFIGAVVLRNRDAITKFTKMMK